MPALMGAGGEGEMAGRRTVDVEAFGVGNWAGSWLAAPMHSVTGFRRKGNAAKLELFHGHPVAELVRSSRTAISPRPRS